MQHPMVADPISGQVAEMEEGRALAELLKQGWKPKRTIIYCAWDGEEPLRREQVSLPMLARIDARRARPED